ncbi:O-antigen ligase family protein [Planococcus sp. PAMC 21323]|uniref:O-antigen ligase family protein n=1 Tax=Planococcus sp. PAMC 21323 TaxID=1526927 RepID=UPI0012E0969C|nr:O-antigen polymerase [Planococcus sp. PAMC 21323]
MNKIILIFGIFSVNLFFSISAIVGYNYNGLDESKIYLVYSSGVACFCFLLSILYLFRKNVKVNKKDLLSYSLPFIFLVMYLLSFFTNDTYSKSAFLSYAYFLLWSVPAAYIAIYINMKKSFFELIKYIEIVMLIFSFSIINSAFIPFISGQSFSSIGGATYQSASYIAAFAYGLNLYFLTLGSHHIRLDFTEKISYKMFCIFLLFIQILGVIISGGRGGIVLVSVYTLVIAILIMKSKKKKNILFFIFLFLSSVITIQLLFPFFMKNHIFSDGFSRVFQFVEGDDLINWSGTSGRDIVYSYALNLIKESPVMGYGVFGYWEFLPFSPHNIVLEILLGGGVIYLAIVSTLFILFLVKLNKMIKVNKENTIIIILFLYPLVMLMFSGTYLISSELWFVLILVFTSTFTNENINFKKTMRIDIENETKEKNYE